MKGKNRRKVSNNILMSSNQTQNVIIHDQINELEVTSIEIMNDKLPITDSDKQTDRDKLPDRDKQPDRDKLPNIDKQPDSDKQPNTMINYISFSNNDQLLHELQGKFICSKCKKMFIKNKKLVQELYTCTICNQIICSECSYTSCLQELLEYCENYLNELLSDNSDFTEMSFESYNVAISIMQCDIENEFKNLELSVLTCSLCIIAAIKEDGILHQCLLNSFPMYYNLLELSKNVNDVVDAIDEMD